MIHERFNIVRQKQTQFLDDLQVDLEFEFKVKYVYRGITSESNVLQVKEYELIDAEPVSIPELIEKFGGKGDREFGDIVTIEDAPTFATIDNNGKGYLIFKYEDQRLVDCFFSGPGGVKRSDVGKKKIIRGFIGQVLPNRIAIMGAHYSMSAE